MHRDFGDAPERIGSQTARIGTLQQFYWLNGIVRMILILNLFDAVLTLIWVYSGLATEANPLLDPLIKYPVLFVIVKFSLVSFGSWLLWRRRKRPLAVVSIFLGFLVYYFLLLYHLSAMNLQLFRRLFG